MNLKTFTNQKHPHIKSNKASAATDTPTLKSIKGVGPKTFSLLVKGGYGSLESLAIAKKENVQTLLNEAGKRYASMNPEAWIEQAKELNKK